MKTIKSSAILLAILALTIPGAEARTFANGAGKKIEADLVGMEGGAAVLKLGNGRSRGRGRGVNKSSSKSSKSETIYTCTLKNSSTKTVGGIEATYTIYKRISTRGDGGSETITEEVEDTIELELLKSRGTVEFVSDPVECLDSSEKSKNGPSQTRRESITGCVVTLSVDGKEILKQCHPENFLDRLEEEAKREKERAKERR